ncbi:hypothetical protein I4U23_010218 [Adineta vaga]|nr:hypothetical protein I4U23_010218 [Adineta vaga]
MSKRNNENHFSIDGQSNQSCSFIYQLPDVLLKRTRNETIPYAQTYHGIILFADVSGFTEMCEKYSNDIQRGVNQLANALNGYMAPIVEAILKEKGDVYKFAGDAVLGLWPFENNSIEHQREQAKRVISCALYMKKSFCDYMTSIGTVLNIKTAIAMEEMIEHCRTNLVNYYVCYGSAVVSVRNAEHVCKSQDIIVDLATWLLLDADTEYIHEKFTAEHDDENTELPSRSSNHQSEIITHGLSNSITSAINKRLTPPSKTRDIILKQKILAHYIRVYGRRNDILTENDLSDDQSLISSDSIEPTNNRNEILKKRTTLNEYSPMKNFINKWNRINTPLLEMANNDMKDLLTVTNKKQERLNKKIDLTDEQAMKLRPSIFWNFEEYDIFDLSTFIIKPVRNHESLDQLSELRLINICFINIILTDYQIKQLPLKLQTIIDCCAEQISITNGLLTKVFMFDKGLSLLCAFGMPGYKHPDDAERALKFSFLITQRLEKFNFVARVSTGVTTGQTFCGVLGHPLRCEYTVIGRKVNMAARLMVNYPGIVSCDDETYHKAHLEERYFELLPTVPLKGLTISSSIRRYKGQDDDQHNMSVFVFSMINREDEWNTILEYLEQVIRHCCITISCIFLTGSTGVGRSRLLAHVNEELMYDTQNIRRVSYNASFEHVQLFGYTLKQLFKKLLYTELQESDALLNVLKSLLPNHEKYLYLLRPYFDKLNIDIDKLNGNSKRKILEEMIYELILNATNPTYEIFNYQPQPTIFIVDDAQYIDKESWQYLHLLGSASTSLLILAMRDPTLDDDELHTRMINLRESSTTKHIQLMGLDNRYLTTLACQAMFVQRIPKDLEILITRKSDKGHPQNVVQLLSDLLSNQIIRIETITNDDDFNDEYVEGLQKYLWKRVAQHDPASGNVKILFEYVEPQLCRICDIDRNKFWTYTTVIENINAHVKIDKLRDFEKRIAKISSLLTKNISKRIIVHAITNYDIHTNEIFHTYQHQLNNNKHHNHGIAGELLKINTAFSQLYRAQIFECSWIDVGARKNSTIARLIHEKNMTSLCCCPENTTKQIENCRMYKFKDPTLKEATLATIIDQFQHDYSSKIALFIESKIHRCKSCGGESDSLIFLTPIQSMKLGMSILDTFHERKLKQLNQRLQNMILDHFSIQQIQIISNKDKEYSSDDHEQILSKEKNLMKTFYHDTHQQELQEKGNYFQQLRNNIQQINFLTKNIKQSTTFHPMAIGGRKDTIEGETYAKIPSRLHENSLIQSDSPMTIIYPTRSTIETPDVVLLKNLKNSNSRNNHCYESNFDLYFLTNNAMNDQDIILKQSNSPEILKENPLRHSPNSKNKRLLTKDIMFEAEHLVKHLHLSRQTDHDSTSTVLIKTISSYQNEKSTILSINERLYMNFTETCPLFLLKEGIDHRFEFLDFAPDLSIRQTFHCINQEEFQTTKTNDMIINHTISHHTTEIEYNQRNCRCNYLLVEIYRLLIKLWDQSSNIEKVFYYSLELARVELIRTNYYESKIILQNLLERLEKERDYLNLPLFFEPQIYDLLSESVYRMRKNDEAFLYVVYGLKILNVQLIDFRSRDSMKLKSQCKQLRHTLIRTLIHQTINKKLTDEEIIQRYFTGKLLFRAGQCARRHGQLLFAYFCVLNATLSLIQCQFVLTSYEHCQSLILLAELSHDLKRMEDCDLFVQAIIRYIEPIPIGYETIAIKSNWLSMIWNLYRGKIDRALNDSYKIKDLVNKIGAYEHLMTVATYSLQAALIGRKEGVIRDLIDIIDNESNRPLQYENRLWSFILTLETFVELNIEYDENLLNEIVLAIDYLLEHVEKKTSTPGDIHKFLTIVFYAQATLVESYTKIIKLDRANEHYMRAIKFGMSLKEWTFRVCNGMLKLALYEVYECTKWLIETRLPIIPLEVQQRLIISHMYDISKHFKLLRPRYLMCLALKCLITGNQRSAKTQFANAIRLANDLELDAERKHIELTRKHIFKVITKNKPISMIKIKQKRRRRKT